MPFAPIAARVSGVHEGAAAGRQDLRPAVEQARRSRAPRRRGSRAPRERRRYRGSSCRPPFRSPRRHRRTECRAAAPGAGRSTTCPRPSCPTSTTERGPSAATIAASGGGRRHRGPRHAACSRVLHGRSVRRPTGVSAVCLPAQWTCRQAEAAQDGPLRRQLTTLSEPGANRDRRDAFRARQCPSFSIVSCETGLSRGLPCRACSVFSP